MKMRGLTCVEEYDDGRRCYQLVRDRLSHLLDLRLYCHSRSQHHHFRSPTTFFRRQVNIIGTHHILDGGTGEKAIKETVPVPEDMGEDEIPENHSCHKTARATM